MNDYTSAAHEFGKATEDVVGPLMEFSREVKLVEMSYKLAQLFGNRTMTKVDLCKGVVAIKKHMGNNGFDQKLLDSRLLKRMEQAIKLK